MRKLFNPILFIVTASLAIAGMNSCGGDDDKTPTPIIPENFILLLDLSDRIINPSCIQDDTALISQLFQSFIKSTQKDLFINSKASFRVKIAPQVNMPNQIVSIAKALDLDLEQIPEYKRRQAIFDFKDTLQNAVGKIYNLAHVSNDPKDYQGADIWRFFNDDLSPLLKRNGTNLLFIITDGYLNFESQKYTVQTGNRFTSCNFLNRLRNPNWNSTFDDEDYGLIKLDKNFSSLKVMVLEIAPKGQFVYEFDLLKKVWEKWFAEMGITSSQIAFYKTQTPFSTIQPEIDSLIALKINVSKNTVSGSTSTFIPEKNIVTSPSVKIKNEQSAPPVGNSFQEEVNNFNNANTQFQQLIGKPGKVDELSDLYSQMDGQLKRLKGLAKNQRDIVFVQKKNIDYMGDTKKDFVTYLQKEIDSLAMQIAKIQESKTEKLSPKQGLNDMISKKSKYDDFLLSVQNN